MAYLPETTEWVEGIYQLEKSDPVSGGAEINEVTKQGISNLAALQLANRTAFLKQRIEALQTTENISVEVGTGGDFLTLSAAIEELSKSRRGWAPEQRYAEIQLRAGYVMEETIAAIGVDLSWITITGADAETVIARDALDEIDVDVAFPMFPAFYAAQRGALPTLSQLFSMNSDGPATNRMGIAAVDGSLLVMPSCGIKNAGGSSIIMLGGSVFADGAIFDGSGDGMSLTRGSRLSFENGSSKDCINRAIRVWKSSTADLGGADFSGASTAGILVSRGGVANARSANARIGETDGPNDIRVENGGIISAHSAVGGTNVTPNELTAAGIIFK